MQVNDKLRATSASSPGKESLLPTDYGAKWAQKLFGRFGEEIPPSSYQETNQDSSFGQPIT